MKNIWCIFLFFSFSFCYPQFAVIKDHDGYVNVRSAPKIADNLSDKLNNGFIVYYFEPKGNWANIDYKKNEKALNGYIYKDKVKFISDFKEIPLKINQDEKITLDDEL